MAEQPNEIQQARGEGKIRRVSADGVRWVIREVPAPAFDRRGGTHLVFDGESVMRRLRYFPADWHALPDHALYELSKRITPTNGQET